MKKIITIMILMLCGLVLATTYDKSLPPDTGEKPSQGAERIRNLAAANQEINDIDHYWPLTGSEVKAIGVGYHQKVTFQAPITTPDQAASMGALYTLDFDGGTGGSKAELCWRCEDNLTPLQITELNAAGDASVLNLTGEYENEVNFSHVDNVFKADSITCKAVGVFTLPTDTTDTTEGNLTYVKDGDTLQYSNSVPAWITLAASPTAAMVKVGTYTGDGVATQAITGVGFEPDMVIVMGGVKTSYTAIKTTDMGTTYSKLLGQIAATYVDDSITVLGSDGFTVGDGTPNGAINPTDVANSDNMNISATAYFYIAAASIDSP